MSQPRPLDDIPEHSKCVNCGECCGIIPAFASEVTVIRQYLRQHPSVQKHAAKNVGQTTCPFRDNIFRRCLIYPVRPVICRLMGVTEGMHCAHGNSAEIDGHPFVLNNTKPVILNFFDWNKK